jgi:hypothetical protein
MQRAMNLQQMVKWLLIAVLFLPIAAEGQQIKSGIIAGFNATQVRGDGIAGFHNIGLHTGVMADIPFKDRWFFTLELLYSQKGSALLPDRKVPGSATYTLNLDYADIPILFNYRDKKEAAFGLGVSIGRLVNFSEYLNGVEQVWSETPYKDMDFNALANMRIYLLKRLLLNVRYGRSITNISLVGQQKFNIVATMQLVWYLQPDDSKSID